MYGLGSGKVFTHNQGLSCAFRQWKAQSHCRFLHGYALQVTLEFVEFGGLSEENWVVDFGGLQEVKDWLASQFDHKVIVAQDDPAIDEFRRLNELGIIQLVILQIVGCEAFSLHIRNYVKGWLGRHGLSDRVRLDCVKVQEHESNYAFWRHTDDEEDKDE